MAQAFEAGGVPQQRFLGIGITGEVVQCGERALKKPRRYNLTNVSHVRRRELEWLMEVSRRKIRTEMQVYKHLGPYDGIIPTSSYELPIDDNHDGLSAKQFEPTISMPYMRNGTVQQYLSKTEPDETLQIMWVRTLAATVAFCHGRNVILGDIGSRNCLLADDLSLKLCDFDESTIISPDLNITEANYNGASVKTDIAQFASVVYEISTRNNLSDPRRPRLEFVEDEARGMNDDDDDERSGWPRVEDLPCTKGIRFGSIVYKCWTRVFQSMSQVSEVLIC